MLVWALLLQAAAGAAPTAAEPAAPVPLLHEYVEIGDEGAERRGGHAAPTLHGEAGSGRVPEAVSEDGQEVEPPARAARPPHHAPSFRPDRETSMQATAGYEEAFSPSVAPFSRGSSLDLVRADYTLGIRDARLRPLVASSAPGPDRTVFYGRVEVLFRRGEPVALPSPAPDLRLLGYEIARAPGRPADRAARVDFLRDGADNLFARADLDGRRILTYAVDAPRSYFQGTLPAQVFASDEPRALVPPLPDRARIAAARVKTRLGLDERLPVVDLLDRMSSYFRSFANADSPAESGSGADIYLDLALGQRGVCRHRAFAFVVTAQALGLPARFVMNDVHAFVEVFVPRLGWRRIDLGGAPLDLPRRMSAEARSRPRAEADDPFPQPESYRRGSAASVVRPSERASEDPTAETDRGAAGASGGASAAEGAPSAAPPPPSDPRAPTHVELDALETTDARRGQAVDVTGRAVADGADAAGLTVDVYLRTVGATRSFWLASAVTDGAGRFRARGVVPREVPGGEQQIVVRIRGDERRAPSR